MATSKVTVTLDTEQLAAVRKLVEGGQARSVSGFVQHAVAVALADVAGWQEELGLALEQTGGAITASERRWADAILGRRSKARRKRRAA